MLNKSLRMHKRPIDQSAKLLLLKRRSQPRIPSKLSRRHPSLPRFPTTISTTTFVLSVSFSQHEYGGILNYRYFKRLAVPLNAQCPALLTMLPTEVRLKVYQRLFHRDQPTVYTGRLSDQVHDHSLII